MADPNEENARLGVENENLLVDSEEFKSKLVFRGVPPSQISDDVIRKTLEQIHRSIDDFVFHTMKEVANNDTLYTSCQKQQSQKRRTHKRGYRIRLDAFIRRQDIIAWGPYDSSNLYILSVIIQWILNEYIFKKSYPIWASEKQIQFLKEVEKGMRYTGQDRNR